MDENFGTVLIHIPDDMPYNKVRQIVLVITEVTKVEGGRESSFTCGNDIMFFKITEDESYEIRNRLVEMFGEDYVYDVLNFTFDDQFDDEQDELGTVCAGCWKDIPKDEKTLYSEDNTPYCEDCYLRLIVGENKKDVKLNDKPDGGWDSGWHGKTLTNCPRCGKPIHDYEKQLDGSLIASCGNCDKHIVMIGVTDNDMTINIKVGNIEIKRGMTNIGEEAVFIINHDGEDESIMLFEDDWECFRKALYSYMIQSGVWKHKEPKEEPKDIPGFEDSVEALKKDWYKKWTV